jgi:hypothetical protein
MVLFYNIGLWWQKLTTDLPSLLNQTISKQIFITFQISQCKQCIMHDWLSKKYLFCITLFSLTSSAALSTVHTGNLAAYNGAYNSKWNFFAL